MLTTKQIQSVCDEIRKDPHVFAILLTGSYVYGSPNDKSDLDIRMIVKEKQYEKAHWDDLWEFGTRIEAFYNTVTTIEEYMEKALKKEIPLNVIHFWAHGKIMHDPEGIAQKLQEKAKRLWQKINFLSIIIKFISKVLIFCLAFYLSISFSEQVVQYIKKLLHITIKICPELAFCVPSLQDVLLFLVVFLALLILIFKLTIKIIDSIHTII